MCVLKQEMQDGTTKNELLDEHSARMSWRGKPDLVDKFLSFYKVQAYLSKVGNMAIFGASVLLCPKDGEV